VLDAELDLSGHYTIVFSDTRSAGLYHVHATAADGTGTADASFRVTDAVSAGSSDHPSWPRRAAGKMVERSAG